MCRSLHSLLNDRQSTLPTCNDTDHRNIAVVIKHSSPEIWLLLSLFGNYYHNIPSMCPHCWLAGKTSGWKNLTPAVSKCFALGEHWPYLEWSLENSLSLSLRFNGHFPGEPGLASVYWSKGWWRWWWQLDSWSYKSCKAPVKSSPPTNQHPVFLQAGSLPVAQPTVENSRPGCT